MRKNFIIYATASSLLLQACAAFPMGRKCPCEDVVLPAKPVVESCVANDDGTAWCCNDLGCAKFPVVNKVCREALQDAELFKWIDYVSESIP